MRLTIGVLILLAQVVMIGVARVHPGRYYTWAPYDSQNEYRVEVTVADRTLTANEIRDRYQMGAAGRNPRSIYEVTSLVDYVERRYRSHERATVVVRYRTNGGPEQVFTLAPGALR